MEYPSYCILQIPYLCDILCLLEFHDRIKSKYHGVTVG